jgi:flagellar biosynthesis protein FlhG
MTEPAADPRLASRQEPPARLGRSGAQTLVVSGGRPGVGGTTLAVNLAAALAHDGLRVVLVDADLAQADVAGHCGISGGLTILDVLVRRRNIHEALQLGPAGMQVVIGSSVAEAPVAGNERTHQRFLRQMRSLTPHADWLIVDAGSQPCEWTARLWSLADTLLLVTTPDAVAVMDSYALVKTLWKWRSAVQGPELVVNRLADRAAAADVHRRIDQSCQRFLGLPVRYAGATPFDPGTGSVGRRGLPAVLIQPHSPLADAVGELARHLTESAADPASQRRAA